MLLIPIGEVGSLVHLLDDLPPTYTSVVSAEGDLTFLGPIRNDAHFGATEIVVEKILEPHTLDTKHAPDIVWIICVLSLHPIVTVRTGDGRRWSEEIQNLRNRKSFRSLSWIEVSENGHRKLGVRKFLAACRVGNY